MRTSSLLTDTWRAEPAQDSCRPAEFGGKLASSLMKRRSLRRTYATLGYFLQQNPKL